MTHAEENELFARVEQGDIEAREELVLKNTKIITEVIKELNEYNLEYEDMQGFGFEALIKAIDNYDYTRGYKFSTYAYKAIKGRLTRMIKYHQRTVKPPRSWWKVYFSIPKVQKKYLRGEDRWPTDKELADELNMDEEKLKEIRRCFRETKCMSLNVSVKGCTNKEVQHLLESEKDFLDEIHARELREQLSECIDQYLSDKEACVIRKFFGLDGTPLNTVEIAEVMGYAQPYISRIKNRSLRKLAKARRRLSHYLTD